MVKIEKQREVLIPCSIYTAWGGRANIVHHLRVGYDQDQKLLRELNEDLRTEKAKVKELEEALKVIRNANV